MGFELSLPLKWHRHRMHIPTDTITNDEALFIYVTL